MRAAAARIVVVLVVLAIATGCDGGDGENVVRPGVEEREGELPSNFPDGFPLPEDNKVLVSGDLTEGVALVLFEAETPEEGYLKFFVDRLPEQGWALASCSQVAATPEPVAQIVAYKGQLQANVTAGFLDVDYPIAYDGPYSFAVQYWKTEGAFATPSAVPEQCVRPGEAPVPTPPPEGEGSPGDQQVPDEQGS